MEREENIIHYNVIETVALCRDGRVENHAINNLQCEGKTGGETVGQAVKQGDKRGQHSWQGEKVRETEWEGVSTSPGDSWTKRLKNLE